MREKESYYWETIPRLIEKHKSMVDECLKILGQKIKADMSDDKMHNVIKSKRMAAETAEWGAKEIDRLTKELEADATQEIKKEVKNYSEQLAE